MGALEDIREASAEALVEAEALAADAHALCAPILRAADDERAWVAAMDHLDRVQRGRIAADDLLR